MKEPVRIAHVIGKLNAAGVEAVINNYYKNIDHSKYQFDFIIDSDGACKPPQDMLNMGARYIVVPPYQKLFRHMIALIQCFRKNKYKIVHSSMNTLSVFSLCAAWIAGVPVRINHNHSTAGEGEKKRNILKYMLRPFAKLFATHYCACSEYAGKWLFGEKAITDNKVTIFNNAIDVEKYRYSPIVREEVRRELGLTEQYVIGHVGRFCYQKNHEFLIDVFCEVHRRNPNTRLLLVGIGETMNDVKDKVEQMGLTPDVIFLGARNDVNRLYQAMDVFVFPSRYEGLGLVLIEAQCSGLPTIASTAVPIEARATDNIEFLPLSNHANEWADRIIAAHVKDRNIFIDQRFDIDIQAKELEQFYDDVIQFHSS